MADDQGSRLTLLRAARERGIGRAARRGAEGRHGHDGALPMRGVHVERYGVEGMTLIARTSTGVEVGRATLPDLELTDSYDVMRRLYQLLDVFEPPAPKLLADVGPSFKVARVAASAGASAPM